MAAKQGAQVEAMVNEGHAVNMGTGKKPDMKYAGETFSINAKHAETLEKSGVIKIVKTKEAASNDGNQ